MKEYGFLQSHSDNSLFTFNSTSKFVDVLVYVDDILVTGNDQHLLTSVKAFLGQQFKVKDLGPLQYFLGIEAARSSKGIYLHQHKYTLDILQDTGLINVRPSKIPMEQNQNLHASTSPLLSTIDASSYRRLVGRLIYLTVTRPYLSYAVQVLSQFLATLKQDHMYAAHKVVRYLKNSPGQGLLMPLKSDFTIHAFCDSDWAGCKESRQSLTGYAIRFGNALLSWKSKK